MKNYLIIFMLTIFVQASGQDLALSLVSSNSSLQNFKNSIGVDIGYSKLTKSGNKIGIRIVNLYSPFDYDYIKSSPADPSTYLIMEVKPESYLWSILGSYSFLLKKNDNANIFIGPLVGLNNFRINESIHRLPNGFYSEDYYTINERRNNKLSIGFMFQYQVNDLILNKIDLLYSISPTIGSYEEFATMGSNDPWFYLSVDFKIGFSYSIGVDE